MRAITFSQFGGPEVLELSEVDVPTPGPGQIRVAVRASGVNAYDWKLRRGFMGGELPKRVGLEFAGIVEELGDGVSDVAEGDAVYGFGIGGTAAEFTRSKHYAPVPEGLDFVAAASLPVAVETAYRVLDLVGVAAGTTLLIDGASGVVGASAVQIAVSRGAHVIGTASEANHAFVRGLGAEPVTYGPGLVERVKGLGVSVLDAAVDAGGGKLADLIELAGGPEHVVTIVDFEGAGASGVTFSGENSAFYALTDIAPLLSAGTFAPPTIAQTFALEQASAAQELSETGHVHGKIVLTP